MALLVMAVVGSGIAATRLSDDDGVRLLVNAIATAATLGVLIAVLAPVSGAHLNPVVTAAVVLRRELAPVAGLAFVVAQLAGAAAGTLVAHAMYDQRLVSAYDGDRVTGGTLVGEVVATCVVLAVVLAGPVGSAPVLVPAWIGAAYFATSSTSFANPAVTVGRALTDSFAGIRWVDVPWFVLAQVVGALFALAAVAILFPTKESS